MDHTIQTNQTSPVLRHHVEAVRAYAGNCRDASLLIGREGDLEVFYAPFDHVNTQARVVIVGITPGATQAENALAEARKALLAGASVEEATRLGQLTGAFSGSLRKNLVDLLNEVGLQRWLSIGSCNQLFAGNAALVQSTSAIPFPVFLSGKNYTGSPDPLRSPLLSGLIDAHFLPQLQRLPKAAILPLGPVPTKVIESLCERGLVDSSRVLSGLPHPSAANAERIAYFLGRKERSKLSNRTNPLLIDTAKARIVERVQGLVRQGGRAY